MTPTLYQSETCSFVFLPFVFVKPLYTKFVQRSEETLTLQKEWDESCEMFALGNKLWYEGEELRGNNLCREADRLWNSAILAAFGKIRAKWRNGDCLLPNGELYRNRFANSIISE